MGSDFIPGVTQAPLTQTPVTLAPGTWVAHPAQPDWGVGQVQSAIGMTITVNFEHAGKRVINAELIQLREISEDELPSL